MAEEIRVLHVDDERDFVETTTRFLERKYDRFVVETATNADDALERLSEDIDCVVSDHEMPGTSGIELLEKVREEYGSLPFILFTGKGSEAVASEAISAGVTDYLQKRGNADQYEILANRITNAVETARAKATARRSKERFESLSEAFPDIAFYINEEGRYVDIIAGDESPLLYDEAEEIVGQRLHEIFPPGTADRFYEVVEEAIETGELQKIEYQLDVRAGERWFEARVVPLETTVSDERTVIWVARDITERKEREHELERQNRRLDDFASFVSHDLRNPLAVAQGRLELAREECDSEHLDSVAHAHERMETLIDDLLELSKSGRPVKDTETVDLEETVGACWRNVDTHGAELVTDTDREIQADRSQLQQMLENLIRNAVEHGSTGSRTESDDAVEHGSTGGRKGSGGTVGDGDGATVTVRVGETEEEDGFYVADDGPGIPEDVREEVFESGYSTSEDGAGLGLSIVEEVAETHGWDVNVEESYEGGARFEVTGVEYRSA